MLKNSMIHSHATRIHDLLRPPPQRLVICQRSYLYQSVNLWNSVDGNIRNYNCIISFKKIIKKLLIENRI